MSAKNSLDWPALLSLGLYHLQLCPDQFWALTPYELMIKSGTHLQKNQTIRRADLEALCQQFPDDDAIINDKGVNNARL